LSEYLLLHGINVKLKFAMYSYWYVLPLRAADWAATACRVRDLWRVLYLPSKQWCFCTLSLWGNEPSEMEDICCYFRRPVAPNSPDLSPVDYIIWGEMLNKIKSSWRW